MPSGMPNVLRAEEAAQAADAIQDAVTRRCVARALGLATTRFVKWDGLGESEFQSIQPVAPFDMLFFVRLMEQLFAAKNRGTLEQLMQGYEEDQLDW